MNMRSPQKLLNIEIDKITNIIERVCLSYNSFSAGLIIFYLLIYVYFLVSNDLLDENNIEDKYDKGFLEKNRIFKYIYIYFNWCYYY